jgi:hypothetical protein
LLALWGLPERICKIVEFQEYPEFTQPDLLSSEYRRETATLHLAHVLERLLAGQPADPSATIYTREYMAELRLPYASPGDLLKERIIPSLAKNRQRLPEQIQGLISNALRSVTQPGD